MAEECILMQIIKSE